MARPSEEELRAGIAAGSREPDDYEELARLLGATGRFEESLAVLYRALELELPARDRARICIGLGWGLYEKGSQGLGQALLLARESAALLEAETTTAEVRYLTGAAQCLLAYCLWPEEGPAAGAARLATAAIEGAIHETPEAEWVGWAHYDAGRAYGLLSEGQKAISHLQAFLDGDLLEYERLSGFSVLAEAFRLAGRPEEAERAVEDALRLAGSNRDMLPLLYHTRAVIHRDAGRKDEARRDFELTRDALARHPTHHESPEYLRSIHENLGELYYDAGDYARAATAYRQLLTLYPEEDAFHAAAQHWLGQCHVGLEEYAEARHYFGAVLASVNAPDEYRVAAERDLLSASAHLARTSGDHEAAVDLFDRLLGHHLEDGADRHRVLLWLAHSLYALERYGEALPRYDDVARSPYAESGDRAQAEEWSRWSAGKVRYEAGELAAAAEAFGRLVDTYPEDHSQRGGALLWLAACYLHLGARAGARECYETVLTAPAATESQQASARRSLADLDRSS